MYLVIVINIFSVFFAYLSRFRKFEDGLKISFILIFFFLALRFHFGNDYLAYLEGFKEINLYSTVNFTDDRNYFEPGWILLNRIFGPVGFFGLVAFLALFNCIIYYYFIKKYIPVKYYWLAVFLYVFNPNFMLIHSSAMRQSVAIALFLFGLEFIFKKKLIAYFTTIFIASLFHTSALILAPVYFIGKINLRIDNVFMAVILSFFTLLFFVGTSLQPLINEFINVYFVKYGRYEGNAEVGTGLGVFVYFLFFFFILFYERFQSQEKAALFKIAIVGFILIPLSLMIELITRVGLYFDPLTIVVYPIVLFCIQNVYMKVAFVSLLIFFHLLTFYIFFNSKIFEEYFSTYQTIFSAPQFY